MTSSRVTALIASCDLADDQPPSPTEDRFEVAEMAQLENGDLVLLRNLGWTEGCVGGYWRSSISEVLAEVEKVVLPDEDDLDPEPHPWEWLATLAARRGLPVTAEHLREVPYKIYLSDRVLKYCS